MQTKQIFFLFSAEEVTQAQFVINADARPAGEHERRYNRGFSEVSVLMNDVPGQRDVVLHLRGGGLTTVSDTHRSYDPLHFVLLFPHGTDGWHLALTHADSNKRLTSREFYCYHLHIRPAQSSVLLRGCRLLQEYCCMAFAKIDNQRCTYYTNNQPQLRAELYRNVMDALTEHDRLEEPNQLLIGRRILLPPSHTGSPRDMHRRYQDAMAIVRKYHKPDLFITVTCNPRWPEITEALLPGQSTEDRPDIVARVFNLKLKQIMKHLTVDGIFGKVVAFLYVVEFQKRGLPHAHILLILADEARPKTVSDVDNIVCAEIPTDPEIFQEGSPQKEQASRLLGTVLHCMVHGPCGPSCLKNGRCSKGFPKQFAELTVWDDTKSYPTYRRRDVNNGGRALEHNNTLIDNRWIVPYNPYLSLLFDAHINVEVCVSVSSTKYLYKYVHKGGDRSMMSIQNENNNPANQIDEIAQYQDMRSIGSSEACWRIYQFDLSDRSPAVKSLRVHLQNEQQVYFNDPREVAAHPPEGRRTELDAFFLFNEQHDGQNRNLKYEDFPSQYVFDPQHKFWKQRQRNFNSIGRIQTVHPNSGDVYYLRILLTHDHCKGKTPFQDLRTVNGHLHETYKEACRSLGLLQDDQEYHRVLQEAALTHLSPQIRQLFVMILIFCSPSNASELFANHYTDWYDDYRRRIHPDPNLDTQKCIIILDIEQRLRQFGKTLGDFELPSVNEDERMHIQQLLETNHNEQTGLLQNEELNAEEARRAVADNLYGPNILQPSQRALFDSVMDSVTRNVGAAIFVDAPGGYGKTFVENTILTAVRTLQDTPNSIALAVATSGIASTLLQGGRTFHSRFKAPLITNEESTLNIAAQGDVARLIREARLIVWDEAPMAHRHLLEALDRTLQDITGSNAPFGAKVILLAGDFRQILPVVHHGSRAQIVNASLKSSLLWPRFNTHR